MKINSVTENRTVKLPNFKKGLTKDFVLKASKINCYNAKKILEQKGDRAYAMLLTKDMEVVRNYVKSKN